MNQPTENQQPTRDEVIRFSLNAYKGIEVGLGVADPGAVAAGTLERQYPNHLILIQAGRFLHGYDRTAHALHALKKYKMKLVGTANDPHIRIGFPIGNYAKRLWPVVQEFGIPYVVALGNHATGRTVYVSDGGGKNQTSLLAAVTPEIVAEVINDLKMRGEVNKASAKALLANPDATTFKLKSQAQELDEQLLVDIIKMPRDLRVTYGENLRACMARIMQAVMAYGMEENKTRLLRAISADVDLVKYYLAQGPRLGKERLKVAFEHRVGMAVELGRLVGGLIRTASPQQ